jgi:hypothetical protein
MAYSHGPTEAGPNGLLVWSDEGTDGNGIDAEEIEQLARVALGV